MEYIDIAEKLKFSRIIQGLWRLTSWNLSKEDLKKFIEERIDLGVTTFDIAEIYGQGQAEIQLGEALSLDKSLRSKIQLVTKTNISFDTEFNRGYYDSTYDRIIKSCLKSIKNMQCDYIDLYLIHREDPCINFEEVAKALTYLKNNNLVKEVGVSNFDPMKFKCLNKALENKLVTNQIEVNPVCFEHFDSGMIDYLTYKKIPPMIWSPLCGGDLFTSDEEVYKNVRDNLEVLYKKYDTDLSTLIYAWLMYHPVNAMPIVGSQKKERLIEAIRALDIKLEHKDWYIIYTASKQKILR